MTTATAKVWSVVWTTAEELNFLDNLGRNKVKGLTRRELLLKYLAAAKSRSAWGQINRDRAIQRARDLLRTA